VITALEWSGSLLAIAGALLLSANVKASPWAFVIYLVSSVLLVAYAILANAWGLVLIAKPASPIA
jgi:hypothetical protein